MTSSRTHYHYTTIFDISIQIPNKAKYLQECNSFDEMLVPLIYNSSNNMEYINYQKLPKRIRFYISEYASEDIEINENKIYYTSYDKDLIKLKVHLYKELLRVNHTFNNKLKKEVKKLISEYPEEFI